MPKKIPAEKKSAYDDAMAIRAGLRTHDRVKIQCYDEDEARGICEWITDAERERVTFTFLFAKEKS